MLKFPRKRYQINKNRNLYYELKNAMTESLSKKYNDFSTKRNSLNTINSGLSKLKTWEYIMSNNNSSSRKELLQTQLAGKISKAQIISPKFKQ